MRTEPQPQVTRTKIVMRSNLHLQICWRTDKQTDAVITILCWGGVITNRYYHAVSVVHCVKLNALLEQGRN